MAENEKKYEQASVWANPLSLLGAWLAGVCLLFILFLMVIEGSSHETSPYTGIITFVVLPALMIAGLLLAAVGAYLERRRRHYRGPSEITRWPILDFNYARSRRVLGILVAAGLVFVGLTAFGSFKAYEYTDSNEFCGTVCHEVMHPEFTAYQGSPHARVKCIECHIGPGAEWFVRSKISGAYQVYAVLSRRFPQPIETPIKNLRPSSDICEKCHWPAQFHGDLFVSHDYYLSDDENTHHQLDLLLKVGGGETREEGEPGIHWHTNPANRVEYIASDARRQEIPWVKVTRADGSSSTFVDVDSSFDAATANPASARTMDCIDCHNRPSHRYDPPQVTVNRALATGKLDRSLTGVKALAVELLEAEHGTVEAARTAIETGIRDAYPDLEEASLARTVSVVQAIYERNYFPGMKVSWKEFPHNIGHLNAPGCFRCHSPSHVDEQGQTLARECNDCHLILARGEGPNPSLATLHPVDFRHPEDIGEAWREVPCTDCHAP